MPRKRKARGKKQFLVVDAHALGKEDATAIAGTVKFLNSSAKPAAKPTATSGSSKQNLKAAAQSGVAPVGERSGISTRAKPSGPSGVWARNISQADKQAQEPSSAAQGGQDLTVNTRENTTSVYQFDEEAAAAAAAAKQAEEEAAAAAAAKQAEEEAAAAAAAKQAEEEAAAAAAAKQAEEEAAAAAAAAAKQAEEEAAAAAAAKQAEEEAAAAAAAAKQAEEEAVAAAGASADRAQCGELDPLSLSMASLEHSQSDSSSTPCALARGRIVSDSVEAAVSASSRGAKSVFAGSLPPIPHVSEDALQIKTALVASYRLYNRGSIDFETYGALKDAFLSGSNGQVQAALRVVQLSGDDADFMDTLQRIVVSEKWSQAATFAVA